MLNSIKNPRHRRQRTRKGQLFVEQLTTLLMMIPLFGFFLGLLDTALIIVGSTVNEGICRDAARVAAGGDPTNYRDRVDTFLNKRKEEYANSFIRNIQFVKEDSGIDLDRKANLNTVSVTTSMDVYPIFILGSILKVSHGRSFSQVRSQHTYPMIGGTSQ